MDNGEPTVRSGKWQLMKWAAVGAPVTLIGALALMLFFKETRIDLLNEKALSQEKRTVNLEQLIEDSTARNLELVRERDELVARIARLEYEYEALLREREMERLVVMELQRQAERQELRRPVESQELRRQAESPERSEQELRALLERERRLRSQLARDLRAQRIEMSDRANSEREFHSTVIQGLPELLWPPPQPSSKVSLPFREALDSQSLLDISRWISSVLLEHGYSEQSFYRVPASNGVGFALVTRLEQFQADGKPLEGNRRYAPPRLSAREIDLTEFIKRLFVTPSGYYRFAVFVATDVPFTPSGPRISARQAQSMLQEGATRLTQEFSETAFAGYQVEVLIYEYRWNPDEDRADSLVPGSLTAQVHLKKSGLATLLGLD